MIHERKMKHFYYGIILITVSVSAFSKTSVKAVCEVLEHDCSTATKQNLALLCKDCIHVMACY
jgi:hypothetical protein